MRNYFHQYPTSQVVVIDFLMYDRERLNRVRLDCVSQLLDLFETLDIGLMSPSEDRCMQSFLDWFDLYAEKGLAVNASYPRPSYSIDHPANGAYTYLNCNTGTGVIYLGIFDDGHGDMTWGAQRIR